MKVKFLGTAAAEGIPGLFCDCENCRKAWELGGREIRKRSSTLIDSNILIDFGPDILSQVHMYHIKLFMLDAILITHSHYDHFSPKSLNMSKKNFAFFHGKENINIYGNEKVRRLYEINKEETSRAVFNTISAFKAFELNGYIIHPLKALHGDADEECLLYAIEKEGKVFLHGNDTNYFCDETWDYIKSMNFSAVALDTTLGTGKAQEKSERGHMNIETVIELKKHMIDLGSANDKTIFVMNHFSHNDILPYPELKKIVENEGIGVAYDGLEIIF